MAEKKNKKAGNSVASAATADSVNLRNMVLTMLAETLENGVFSHVVVNNVFSEQQLISRDRAFVSRLYLGVIERIIYIDYCINKVSSTNTAKMKPVVLNILREGVYQLLFMDSVPDHAALNEAAKLAKKRGFTQLVPFVNGVLRAVARSGREELEKDMPENVRYSVPKWLFDMVMEQSGREASLRFFEGALNREKNVTIRLNSLKAKDLESEEETKETIISALEDEGCKVIKKGEGDCYILKDFQSLTGLKAFKNGLFSVQDSSSAQAALEGARALEKQLGGRDKECLIVDVCASPGGKSICAAQHLPNAKIISRDLTEPKVEMIRENIKRLGINSIEAQVHDALIKDQDLVGKADMVIADLPCSGLGVIGGKPDIKFRVRQKDLGQLEKLQRDILDVVSEYVKPEGILLYSTCTVNKGENDDNVDYFIAKHDFKCISRRQIMETDGDGFYIAVLKRQ